MINTRRRRGAQSRASQGRGRARRAPFFQQRPEEWGAVAAATLQGSTHFGGPRGVRAKSLNAAPRRGCFYHGAAITLKRAVWGVCFLTLSLSHARKKDKQLLESIKHLSQGQRGRRTHAPAWKQHAACPAPQIIFNPCRGSRWRAPTRARPGCCDTLPPRPSRRPTRSHWRAPT